MTEAKLKIIDWNRDLFPDLTLSLEQHGQIEDVLRDEDGITVDGVKREILLGRENVRVKVVPKGSATSNIHHLNKIQRRAVVKHKYEQLYNAYGSMEAKEAISKQYGLSIRTIERDLNQDAATNVVTSKPPSKSHMYEDTKTWNPFVGCEFDCTYCEPSFKRQLKRQKKNCLQCYRYDLHEHPERISPEKLPADKCTFVCGDSDITFANPDYMKGVFKFLKENTNEDKTWFIQSKDPKCFEQYLEHLPKNTILLTTLETNKDGICKNVSKAPLPSVRYEAFRNLNYPRKIVTVEPIMDFDLEIFADWIARIKPEAVFIGYNNHPNQVKLIEPNMEKTLDLIVALKNKGIHVLTKELRKMAYKDLYSEKTAEKG